jgi:hypothetical protein
MNRYLGLLFKTLLCFFIVTSIGATEKARIAFIGDHDDLTVGQDGFCGPRKSIPRPQWQSVFAQGGQRVWFELKAKIRTSKTVFTCKGDYSFFPEAGKIYIVRYRLETDRCEFDLFQAQSNADPIPLNLTFEEPRPCLLSQ